jgi:hypothetical protein
MLVRISVVSTTGRSLVIEFYDAEIPWSLMALNSICMKKMSNFWLMMSCRRWKSACGSLHSFLFGSVLNLEDEGDIFLRNVGWPSTDCMSLYPRRYDISLRNNLSEIPKLYNKLHCPVYEVYLMDVTCGQFAAIRCEEGSRAYSRNMSMTIINIPLQMNNA